MNRASEYGSEELQTQEHEHLVLDQRSQNVLWLFNVAPTSNPGFESEVGDTEESKYIVARIDKSRLSGVDYVGLTDAPVQTGDKLRAVLEWELRTLLVHKALRTGGITKLELKVA